MSTKRVEVPKQNDLDCIKNFDEVIFGYSKEQAINEAKRCLNCKHKPCIKACPAGNKIPEFIAEIVAGEFQKAYEILCETTNLPAICGRVCPQEKQCEGSCVRGIRGEPVAIGLLERFVSDLQNIPNKEENFDLNSKKVAIVGSGPAGISCAFELLKYGHNVTIFEKSNFFGGVLMQGIPRYRIPKEIVAKEQEKLENAGVKIVLNTEIGVDKTIDDLLDNDFQAVFLGAGACDSKSMNIIGEDLSGVITANEYLKGLNVERNIAKTLENDIYKAEKVVVLGGGNVAMDASRMALRTGAKKVSIVYRRTENELPARDDEVYHAKAEGVEFLMLFAPSEILADTNERVCGIKCDTMMLGEPDESGRRSPVKVPNQEVVIDAQAVIVAIGSNVNPTISNSSPDIEVDKYGCFVVDENGQTSKSGVFAGGDVVTGPETVVKAMVAGKLSAKAIDEYLNK